MMRNGPKAHEHGVPTKEPLPVIDDAHPRRPLASGTQACTKPKEDNRLRRGEVIERIKQDLQVPGEMLLVRLQLDDEFVESRRIRIGGREVARQVRRVIGERCASSHDL